MSEALKASSDFKQDPILLMPGGDELLMPGSQFLHNVKSEDTNDMFSVIEIISPPGKGVSLPVHEHEDELVYLLGDIEVTLGDQTMTAVSGVMVLLPMGIPHGFVNNSDKPSRLLVTILPGAFDNYFVELAGVSIL